MNLRILIFLLAFPVAGSIPACGGGGSGEAPTISNLSIPSPVKRGVISTGSVDVRDKDGLGSMAVNFTFSGPAALELNVPLQGATNTVTAATVQLPFTLTDTSPVGNYTVKLVAEDADGNESNELEGSFVLE